MRIARILTALVICAGCGFTATRGFELVGFAITQQKFDLVGAAAFSHFFEVPGVRYAARDSSLSAQSDFGPKDIG